MTASAGTRGRHLLKEPSSPASDDAGTPPGRIVVADRVVAGLAAQVASEQPDAGAPAGRLLGLAVPGSALLGNRDPNLDHRPKVSATVNGAVATVEVTMSVRWPASVRRVTEQVRSAIRQRVGELAGLDVVEVRIQVTDFAAPAPSDGRRVR